MRTREDDGIEITQELIHKKFGFRVIAIHNGPNGPPDRLQILIPVRKQVLDQWKKVVTAKGCSPTKVFTELVAAQRRADRLIKKAEPKPKQGLQSAA